MKYAIKLRTSHHFSMTAYLIPHNSKTYNSYLGYFKYYIHKNLGLDNLDGFCSNFLSLIFLSPICLFLSPCGHWRQLGDRMETERRQENVNDFSRRVHWRNFVNNGFCAIYEYISTRHAQNADCLLEYVMPLIFKKDFLYYDSMHASPSSTIIKIAKWTFFQILQSNKPASKHTLCTSGMTSTTKTVRVL